VRDGMVSDQNKVNMMPQLKKSCFPLSYDNKCKKLILDTKNKIKVQVVKKTKMFILTYNATLVGNGWSLITTITFSI
jgi:hypothetical protein